MQRHAFINLAPSTLALGAFVLVQAQTTRLRFAHAGRETAALLNAVGAIR